LRYTLTLRIYICSTWRRVLAIVRVTHDLARNQSG
jgi:hypothetical protein